MLHKKLFFSFLILGLIISSCKKSPIVDLEKLDLMSYDMPIEIMAPANAEIVKLDLVVQKDITVKKGDEYYVQIFESDVDIRNVSEVKERLLKDIQENPYFDSLILEETEGFIYKTLIDSSNINYGFRHIRIQGDKEYVFQTGLIGTFTLPQVEMMYNAVK